MVRHRAQIAAAAGNGKRKGSRALAKRRWAAYSLEGSVCFLAGAYVPKVWCCHVSVCCVVLCVAEWLWPLTAFTLGDLLGSALLLATNPHGRRRHSRPYHSPRNAFFPHRAKKHILKMCIRAALKNKVECWGNVCGQ